MEILGIHLKMGGIELLFAVQIAETRHLLNAIGKPRQVRCRIWDEKRKLIIVLYARQKRCVNWQEHVQTQASHSRAESIFICRNDRAHSSHRTGRKLRQQINWSKMNYWSLQCNNSFSKIDFLPLATKLMTFDCSLPPGCECRVCHMHIGCQFFRGEIVWLHVLWFIHLGQRMWCKLQQTSRFSSIFIALLS